MGYNSYHWRERIEADVSYIDKHSNSKFPKDTSDGEYFEVTSRLLISVFSISFALRKLEKDNKISMKFMRSIKFNCLRYQKLEGARVPPFDVNYFSYKMGSPFKSRISLNEFMLDISHSYYSEILFNRLNKPVHLFYTNHRDKKKFLYEIDLRDFSKQVHRVLDSDMSVKGWHYNPDRDEFQTYSFFRGEEKDHDKFMKDITGKKYENKK